MYIGYYFVKVKILANVAVARECEKRRVLELTYIRLNVEPSCMLWMMPLYTACQDIMQVCFSGIFQV